MSDMLVCDYDGTLNTDFKIDLRLNINAIKKFMGQGNKFVISTARGFNSIKYEINKYNIPYDYLTCNNGAVIFDNRDNVMYKNTLSKKEIDGIKMAVSSDKKRVYFFDVYGYRGNEEDIIYGSIPVSFFYDVSELEELLHPLEVQKRGNHVFVKKQSSKLDGALILERNLDVNKIYAVGDGEDDRELLKYFGGYKMFINSLKDPDMKMTTSVHSLIKKIMK